MRLWDTLREFSSKYRPSGKDSRKKVQRKPRTHRPRDLRVEQMEDRVLLSITPGTLDRVWQDTLERAIQQAADLNRYSDAQLQSTTDWVVGIGEEMNPSQVATLLGAQYVTVPTGIKGAYVFRFSSNLNWRTVIQRLENAQVVNYFYPLVGQERSLRLIPNDPLFVQQWHLLNTGQSGGVPGADLNVVNVWDTYQGDGVIIGIVDDGIDTLHADLVANYRADLSYDYFANDSDPQHELPSDIGHGTAVAGTAAAVGNNATGVTGVAFDAQLAAIRLISGSTTDLQEAQALSHRSDLISIYNNSWGPAGPSMTGFSRFAGPGPLTLAAIQQGVTTGRNGLGNIYVFAAGNDGYLLDNVNYDGFANLRYVIAVGALNENGQQAFYSEPGACLFVVAPGGELADPNDFASGIITTDWTGTNGFDAGNYAGVQGTSFAAPAVSGVIALMLQANPNLTYRDVQYILAQTARKVDPADADWTTNAAGYHINHKYGFGAVDAAAAVQAARNWKPVGPELAIDSGVFQVNRIIPDNSAVGISSTVSMASDINRVEWVEVTVDISHISPGDLEIVLVSPSGTQSVLATPHIHNPFDTGVRWTFTTNRNWGETSGGDWTLIVRDRVGGVVGRLNSWRLTVYGQQVPGTPPDLVAVIPNEGSLIEEGAELLVAPRELILRFNEGQQLNPNTLGAIQFIRAGGDDSFAEGNEVVIPIGYIGIGDKPNEVIVRFAENLPDDKYHLVIKGTGANPLMNLDSPPLPFRYDADLGTGRDLTMEFDINVGPQVLAVVPQPVYRGDFQITAPAGSQITDGQTFRVSDGTFQVTFEFDTGNGVRAGNVAILYSSGDSASLIAQKIGAAILAQGLNLTVLVNAAVVTLQGAQVSVDRQTSPLIVKSLYQERNVIEVYFNDDDLDRNAAQDPRFYQLIFTRETASPDDDLVVTPTSVTYNATKNLVRLVFGQDLANYGTGSVRLRIGSAYQPIQTWNMSEGGDAASTFYGATVVSGFGTGTVGQSVIISGSIVTPISYNLEWPGAIDEPGHRDLPDYDSILIEDHYLTGESSPDGSTQIPSVPYYFPRGSFNLITEAQKQRAREIFDIYGYYLGIQFYETDSYGLAIITGDLALMGLQSAPGGVAGVAGMGVAVMDYAEDWGASEFGGGWFQVAMHEIGHLLGYGHSYDLQPFVIMGSSEDAQAVVGSFEPVFPGVADIIHGRHMFRPDNMDIDMYRFDLNERGQVDIEVLAERLNNSSLLDASITLYREVQVAQKYVVIENGVPVEKEFLQTTYEVVARNDDFYSEDSAISIYLPAGRYYIGVSASGNTQYDPTLDDSGIGGVTQGEYKLRVTYKPGGVDPNNPDTFREPNVANPSRLIDSTGVYFDGDLDGIPGGDYNFWFTVQPESQTIFVDKLSGSSSPTGSIDNPFSTIAAALAAAQPGSIVRIVGNNFANDDPSNPATLRDNIPYEIGRRLVDNAPLADGVRMDVPKGVTVMIDAGAMIKLFRSNIMVGSIAEGIDRSGGALQVLGTPYHSVYFTSYYDESLGRDPEPNNNTTPLSGDWGGIVFKNDLDYQFIKAYNPASGLPARQVLEDQGIFLNYISHADMRYGGGEVIVNGVRSVYNPVHMVEARPTVVFSRVTKSADAAMSADPNSFADTKYQSWDPNNPYTVAYDRVGPTIRGNYVVDNTINGLYVRIKTPAGGATKKLTTFARWDDWDIVHYVPETLVVSGTPGGPLVRQSSASAVTLVDDFRIRVPAATPQLDGQYFAIFDGRTRVIFEFDAGDGVVAGRIAVPFTLASTADEIAASLANAINQARTLRKLDVSATSSGDTVTLRQWGAKLVVEGLGNREARIDARLMIDPGVVVKLQGSRIETEIGAQIIAEGRPGYAETVPGYKVVLTSVLDNRYGAGGTFNTAQNTSGQQPAPGNWAGIAFEPLSEGSIDQAIIAYAGGQSAIEGGFAGFDPIEIRQAHVRIANTRFENNGANSAGDRNGRGFITPATIYVRGAQPVIVNNLFMNNQGHVVSIDVNALNAWEVPDWGRSTGFIDAFTQFDGNFGPLVRGNRMSGNAINGMEVRAGNLNGQGVWDDTDIVHVVYGNIVISDYHHEGGLRLQSSRDKSLVVKLWGQNAGFTATGSPTEVDDRVGGILQIIGMPGYPVIFTSLADDSVGAGFDRFGNPQYDTNGNGQSRGTPGDWGSIRFDEYAHDRNVATVIEAENASANSDLNPFPQQAQYLGQLAPNEKAGDDNLRLGFDVYGAIRFGAGHDADVYSFDATAGTEIWLDIDRTTFALDTIIELIDADGNVLARSDNSLNEAPQGSLTTLAQSMNRDLWIRSTSRNPAELGDYYSINPRDAGMRVVLPGPVGEVHTYYVRVRSPLAVTNIPAASQIADGTRFLVSDHYQTIVFEFDTNGSVTSGAVPVAITPGMTADQVAGAMMTAINAQRAAKGFEVTARYQGGKLFLDGVHAQFNALNTPVRVINNTSGHYQLQIRLKEMQEVAGGMVKYADVRYATNGIEILGQPAHHPLLGEISETSANNDTFGNAQYLGNLLDIDRNTISVAGYLSGRTDVDWYRFDVDLQGIQSIGGLNDLGAVWSTIFDIDYADGMARPDLSIWVFDSQGRLILRSTDSSIADDMALVISNAIEDLNRGSVWSRDPYIGPVYLPESNTATYYIAVTSVLATPQVLSSVIGGTWSADSTANPLVRLEPINSITRIVEEHIEGGAASQVTTVQQRLSLVPDEFKLGDVVFYTLTGTDLFTVDPFTGATETDVTDWNDPYLPGSPGIVYHDIAMRNDGRLMTITQGPGNNFSPRYREFDTGNANNLLLDVDTGIDIYRRDPANLNNLQADPNQSAYIEAMVHYYQNTGNLGRHVIIVGNVPNPDLGGGLTGITSGHNLVWLLDPNGNAVNHPLINNGQRASGARLFSNIVPIGQLFTAPTILVNPASQLEPVYQFPGGVQPRDFQDGDWFQITNAAGTTYTFEFDLGIDVRIDPQGAAAFRDGHFFTLVNANTGVSRTFEFNSGPVIVLPASATPALDGVVVTIHGTAPTGGNVSIAFEFDNNNSLTNPGNVRVSFNNGDQGSVLAANLVTAINAQSGFTVVASSVNNRVSLVNDSLFTPPTSSDPLVQIQGNHGVTFGRQPISFEETWTSQQLGQNIETIVDAAGFGVDASYAYRTTDSANPLSPGDRISFLNVGSFSFANAPGLSYVEGSHGTTVGIRVPFGAGYTAQQMAAAMVNVINATMGAGTATVVGATVELANVAATNPVYIPSGVQLGFEGEGAGGDITGLAYINLPGTGYRLFAVSDTGGLYYIDNVSASANGGSWGFIPQDPQSGVRYFQRTGGGPQIHYIGQVVDPATGAPIRFTGLAAGPQNVEDGKYAQILFGSDTSGRIWAFNTEGTVLNVFLNGATNINPDYVGTIYGIDFSPIDYNLWHRTERRWNDEGHGVYSTYDSSRVPAEGYNPLLEGNRSYYFGLDATDDGLWNDPQPGAVNFTTGQGSDGSKLLTYNLPGGAHGSLTSGVFSLKGYSPADKPTLYFNYFAQTENSNDFDGVRVYISNDGANWTLLATNTDLNDTMLIAPNREQPGYGGYIREIIDLGGNWRQARLDLSQFAGFDNLRIRFDFSTASDMDIGEVMTGGEYLTTPAAAELHDGATFEVGGLTFEFDLGLALVLPNVAGIKVQDGDYFTVSNGTTLITFEFDKNGTVQPGNVAIAISDNMTTRQVADTIAAAVNGVPAFGVRAFVPDDSIFAGENGYRVFLISAQSVTSGTYGTLPLEWDVEGSAPGQYTAGNIPVYVRPDMTQLETSKIITDAINRAFRVLPNQIYIPPTLTAGNLNNTASTLVALNALNVPSYVVMGFTTGLASPTIVDPATLPLPAGTRADYAVIVGLQGATTPAAIAARIAAAVNLLRTSLGIQVFATSTPDGFVQLLSSSPQAAFDGLNLANPASSPLLTSDPNGTTVKLDDRTGDTLGGTQPFMRVFGASVTDPGPLFHSNVLQGDETSKYYGNTARNNNRFFDYRRGQNNNYEGWYIDDIIIGFAERGEMVTNAPAGVTGFDFLRQPRVDEPIVVTGSYQLEIRRGDEFGNLVVTPYRVLALQAQADTNDRWTQDITILFPDATKIAHGDRFWIEDGVNRQTFVFLDVDIGTTKPLTPALTGSEIPVYFTSVMSAGEIANAVANAINFARSEGRLNVSAASIATSERVDLWGATAVGGNLGGADPQPIEQIIFGATDVLGQTRIRLTPSAGNAIAHRDTFYIEDAYGNGVQFIFLHQNSGEVPPAGVYAVYFNFGMTNVQIANLIRNAINQAYADGKFLVQATITGPGQIDLSVEGKIASGLPYTTFFDPTPQPGVTLFHPDPNGHPLIGDKNFYREKGHIIVESTSVIHASQYGIRVEPGTREAGSNAPHPGSGRTMNAPNQLVSGVTLKNNLLAFNGQGGIRISGSTGQPTGAIPYVRVVNNTVYGGLTPQGVGIEVVNNAGPTLLNNVLANLNVGIRVDASSNPNTVLGGNAYQGNNQNVQGTALGTFDRVLAPGAPLFVDPANYNFIPDRGSEIIDSSIDVLQERFGYYTSVLQPIGLAPSPIIAPAYDLYGQLRKDDPAVNPAPGGGLSIYKDRGAIDRVDFRGPTAWLIEPLDNDAAGVDRNPASYDVFIAGQRITRFAIRLSDEDGVGINDLTVLPDTVKVYRENVLLEEGKDYFFQYHPVDNIIYLVPASGIWSIGYTYKVELDSQAIRDLANNPLQPNRPDGTTYFMIYLAGIDFGDAPDAPYPTTLKNNGASHIIVPGYYLGSGVSNEPDARQNATATGDTLDDGVIFDTGILIGGGTQVKVIASAEGYLDAWIDLNADGDWSDAGEKVLNSYALLAGENLVTITLPAGLTPATTFARFRFSSIGGLSPTGLAPDGEVEDYQVQLVPYHEDFGDAPDSYGTVLGSNGARHRLGSGLILGQIVDAELNGRPTTLANGDDLAGLDDEDGVTFLDALVPGNPVEVQVVVTLPGALSGAYLQGWVDFNGDGDFADVDEQIFTNLLISSSGVHNLFFTVPATATKGITYARFRLSTQENLAFNGAAPDGEVEDYRVAIVDAPVDFGDAPSPYPTLQADNGARHRIVRGFHLGRYVDYELDGQPNPTATGDDSIDLADEDGVVFLTPLLTGELTTLEVYASQGGGYLNAWIDFNADGDWSDVGEQVFVNQVLATGVNTLQFRVPRDLVSATTFARFRYSHTPDLSYTTPAATPADQLPDGEVEDYLVRIIAGTSSLNGYVFNDLNANGVWDRNPSSQLPAVDILPPGAGNIVVPVGDDMVSGAIPLGFDFEFFGKIYQQIYVSTNGIVTFENPVSAFSASGFPQSEPMLAPFWSDVDTRATGQIRLQRSTSARGNPVVQVDWINVGYFNQHSDKKNTFSLYIEDDPGGDIVVFHYYDMQWTTGDTFGVNGFGAPGAVIGFDAGDGIHYATYARPSSPTDLAALMAQGKYGFRLDPNTGQLFGVEPGTAGIQVFVDLNGNGVYDSFEPITTTQFDNPLTPNVDETGYYEFTGLFSGSYVVREVVPTGWVQTFPPTGIVLPDGQTRHVRAPSGAALADGQTFTISNGTLLVTFEFDNNGVVAGGNRRVAFTATDSPAVVATAVASAVNGVAGFGITATADGDLVNFAGATVIFNPHTSPLQDVTTRSQADGSYAVTLGTGEQLSNVTFGNYRVASVSVTDVAVAEGNSGRTKVLVTVEIANSFGAPIRFDYQTADGTALVGNNDYIPASGTFVFTPQGVPRPTWDVQYLTKNATNDYDFSAWGDRVVWESFDGQDWEIFLFDGSETRRLTNNTRDDRFPVVFGQYVAWSGHDGQDYEIYLYDSVTGTTRQLTDNDYSDLDPVLSNDYVVWTASVGGRQQVFLYDIMAGGDPINISNNSFNNYLPKVSGRNVVWYAYDGFDNEIYLYSGGTTRRVTNNTLDDRFPQVDGSRVVWQQHDGTDWEIALYDIPSGTTTLLTSNNTDDTHPDISGNNVVFERNDGTDLEIYYINLNIGPTAQKAITNNTQHDEMPHVYGNRLVWHSFVNGNWEVFYADLDSNAIPKNLSSDPGYDWYPAVTSDLVVWRSYRSGNYEIFVARQVPAVAKATIELEIVGDTRIEPDEYFLLNISNPQLAVIADPQAQIWILNDDGSLDYGDAPAPYPTLLADNGARHLATSGLRLGNLIDAEPNGRPSANADGDDTYLSDDEDGVVFLTPLTIGTQASISVIASAAGKLDAWLDFNADGDWNDPGERIFAGRNLVAGANVLTFDVPATAVLGKTYARFRLSSTGVDAPTGFAMDGEVEDYAVDITESVVQVLKQGRRVVVTGGVGNDQFELSTSGSFHSLLVNGNLYTYALADIDEITIDGNGGNDSVVFHGTAANETFVVTPTTVSMTRTGFTAFASNVESIQVLGNGGTDAAQIYDSPGDDQLSIQPGHASMSGPGYQIDVIDVDYVHGYSSTGNDGAILYGTPGDDSLTASATETRLTASGYLARTKFFKNVRVISDGAGNDVATITGTTGDDVIATTPSSASLTAATFQIVVEQFDSVTILGNGGSDVAQLRDSAGDDWFIARPGESSLTGPGYMVTVRNVPTVHAYASTGVDVAQLYDSVGDDTVVMTPDYTRITGPNYMARAKAFDFVHAYSAQGGFDTVKLYGSAGNDTLTVDPTSARLKGSGFYNRAKFFERIEVYGGGGYDTGVVYDSAGVDHLQATSVEALLQNPDLPYYVYLTQMEKVKVRGNSPYNTKHIEGVVDWLIATGFWTDI
jgi:subtilisin-like proprotein convertase family protein